MTTTLRALFREYRALQLRAVDAYHAAQSRLAWTRAAAKGLARFRYVSAGRTVVIVAEARYMLGLRWETVGALGTVEAWDRDPAHVELFDRTLAYLDKRMRPLFLPVSFSTPQLLH